MVAMKGVIPHTTPLFMAGIRLLPAGILILIVAALFSRPQPKSPNAANHQFCFAHAAGKGE